MIRAITVICVLTGISSAFAALSPFYQRSNEIRALVTNEEITTKLGGEGSSPIRSITRDDDTFMIDTNGGCSLPVRVKYKRSTVPGPVFFQFEPGQLDCVH